MPSFFPTVPVADVEDNKIVKCSADGLSVLLVRDSSGTVFAFENNCSHADKPLERGVWNPQSREMLCPYHKAVFDVGNNGAVKVGPAVVALSVYPVEIRQHRGIETVFVGLETDD